MKHLFITFLRNIKKYINKLPGGNKITGWIQTVLFSIFLNNNEKLFSYYFKTNKWGNKESISGPGSTLDATKNLREVLPKIFLQFKITKVLDAPCGDYHWFRYVNRDDEVEYIGGDIVPELIQQNRNKYENEKTRFLVLDIISDEIPESDLWICRDALFHFSNEDIIQVLTKLQNGKVRYFLSTTYPGININHNIKTGSFRKINLQLPPFNLKNPIKIFDDSGLESQDKKIGLWCYNESLHQD